MSRVLAFLNEQPRVHIVFLCFVSVAFLGTLDYLTGFAETNGVDLIVICSRGQSGPNRRQMGSVADRVVRGASAPVLLVQAPSNGRQQPETSRG